MAVRGRFSINGRHNDYPYYRQVWTRVILALLTASLIPLIVIGGGVSSYTFDKLESHTLDALREQVHQHQQAIDTFLAERENQLSLIASLYSMEQLIAPGRLENILNVLRQQTPGFLDLGVIDMQGRHRAYVGSHALLSKNYSQEEWFRKAKERARYISDVYLGFRQTPHFIMAVKQGRGDTAWILRATVDSDTFDALVAGGPGGLNADTFIVNRDGLFQTRSQTTGKLLTPSGIRPDPFLKGIQLVPRGDVLMLTLWQRNVPWLNVVQVKRSSVYGGLNRVRLAVILTFVVGAVLIVATVLLTTGKLVGLLESKGRSLRILDKQLRRTSYLSSSMELSLGFFEEVKDILSNIDVSLQWLLSHDTAKNAPDVKETLLLIAREASRGHGLIDKFAMFVRAEDPVVIDVSVNELLDDLLTFLNTELQRRTIRVIREYQTPLPAVRSDRGKLRQVFQNLILNAIAVLEKGGQIRLLTRADGDHVVVVVSDNGPGVGTADRSRIFEPLYTTKPQGTGLGLPICKTILGQLNGTLTMDSQPGRGAAFTVKLPCRIGATG
jgi:two-component system, NtrC family, sensor kinase